MDNRASEQICIISRIDRDETDIIDAVHPNDLHSYMEYAYNVLETKLNARIKECVRPHKLTEPLRRVHKEGQYFGVEITLKFDDGEYPWVWREFYDYTIKMIWKPQIA